MQLPCVFPVREASCYRVAPSMSFWEPKARDESELLVRTPSGRGFGGPIFGRNLGRRFWVYAIASLWAMSAASAVRPCESFRFANFGRKILGSSRDSSAASRHAVVLRGKAQARIAFDPLGIQAGEYRVLRSYKRRPL